MFKLILIILSALWLIASCKADEVKQAEMYSLDETSADTINERNVESVIERNVVQIYPDIEQFNNLHEEILFPGEYHSGEVSRNAQSKLWFALTMNDSGGYLLKQTSILKETIFDVISDEDVTIPTGISIKTNEKDSVLYLLGNVAGLKNGIIQTIEHFPSEIKAGKDFYFFFNREKYRLFATGKYTMVEGETYTSLEEYQLFVELPEEIDKKTTLLSSFPYFDDSSIELLFIGDIDQDGLLDFIIDNSPKYNSITPTLYLSSKIKKDKLVKFIAISQFVGC